MAVKQFKINAVELEIGMYVSKLDRPWTQTPFALQGFHVQEQEDIQNLQHFCRYVYIDIVKSKNNIELSKFSTLEPGEVTAPDKKKNMLNAGLNYFKVAPIKIDRHVYVARAPLKKEKKQAKKFHAEVAVAMNGVFQQVEEGRPLKYQEVKNVSHNMVESIIRNPDAFAWLSRIKEKDEHTYSHSVRSAIWATLFGRHIGLNIGDLEALALGVLLKDVGKTKLPTELWDLEGLPEGKLLEAQKFVEHSVNILEAIPGVSSKVVSVVATHCERHNGSGFPQGMRGDKIPLLGKVAGVVACYDAITNPRRSKHPLSSTKAIAQMYQMNDILFQQDMVLEFIKAIGLYPTGTLVELSTGEVGVVVEQNEERRMRPKVMVLIDANNNAYKKPRLLDLHADAHCVGSPEAWPKGRGSLPEIDIKRDLEPDAYDIDIATIRDDHVFKQWRFPRFGT